MTALQAARERLEAYIVGEQVGLFVHDGAYFHVKPANRPINAEKLRRLLNDVIEAVRVETGLPF